MPTYHFGLTKHPDEALLIANIIARWNVIEEITSFLLAGFMTSDSFQAKIVLDSLLNSGAKLDLVRAAGKYALHGSDLLDEFQDLMDELKKRLSVRNRYAHGVYGINDKGKLVMNIRGVDRAPPGENLKKVQSTTPVSLKALQKEFDLAGESFNKITKFNERLHETAPQHAGAPVPSVAWLRRAHALAQNIQDGRKDKGPTPGEDS